MPGPTENDLAFGIRTTLGEVLQNALQTRREFDHHRSVLLQSIDFYYGGQHPLAVQSGRLRPVSADVQREVGTFGRRKPIAFLVRAR